MKTIINKVNYSSSKVFCKLLIEFIGFIRRHSDNNTRTKIDKMVSESIINSSLKILSKT